MHQWGAHLALDSGRPHESHIVSPCPHPPFALSTALSPEEAESALEAAHYFTEDSSSEGERCWHRRRSLAEASAGGLQPWGWGTCPVGVLSSQGTASLWADPWVFSLVSLVSAFLDSGLALPPSALHSPPLLSSISSGLRVGPLPALGGSRSVPAAAVPSALGFLQALGSVFLTVPCSQEACKLLVPGTLLSG